MMQSANRLHCRYLSLIKKEIEQLPFPVTKNSVGIEDEYAFLYENMICLLTTDNHGILEEGGGILWKSDDGVSFGEKELRFKLINE